jgi:hypothetical protein
MSSRVRRDFEVELLVDGDRPGPFGDPWILDVPHLVLERDHVEVAQDLGIAELGRAGRAVRRQTDRQSDRQCAEMLPQPIHPPSSKTGRSGAQIRKPRRR